MKRLWKRSKDGTELSQARACMEGTIATHVPMHLFDAGLMSALSDIKSEKEKKMRKLSWFAVERASQVFGQSCMKAGCLHRHCTPKARRSCTNGLESMLELVDGGGIGRIEGIVGRTAREWWHLAGDNDFLLCASGRARGRDLLHSAEG